jgi:hypothetical protein
VSGKVHGNLSGLGGCATIQHAMIRWSGEIVVGWTAVDHG